MRNWLRPLFRNKPQQIRRRTRLSLEALEDRRLLAAPVIDSIAVPLNIPALKTLIVPITATDSQGGSISYNVVSDNPAVTVQQHTGNTFLDITVANFGTMEFELFNDLTPQTVAMISGMVKSEFYDGLTFHRVVPNFVIQGGDPAGTGSGNVGFTFNDEFNPSEIFSGSGQLAMANSGKDTNGSQFFITNGTQRFLDFNHTIFGQLVRGFEFLKAIEAVPTTGANGNPAFKPLTPVVISSAKIIQDATADVITLSTTAAAGATAHLTITATSSTGGSTSQSVAATVVADVDTNNGNAPINDPPILGPVSDKVTPVNTPLVFNVTSTDLDAETSTFEAVLQGTSANNATVAVNGSQVTVTPNQGFQGALSLLVGAKDPNATSRGSTTDPFDTQLIQIGVGDQALTPATSGSINLTEGAAASVTQIGSFTDANTAATPSDYKVSINWGDGTPLDTSTGQVQGSSGNFIVTGAHVYREAGKFPVQITVNDVHTTPSGSTGDQGGARTTLNSTAVVADAALTATGTTLTANAGTALSNVVVATFTDADANTRSSDFTASINWGDGTTTAGTIQAASGGGFQVLGSHTYASKGSFNVGTAINDVNTAGDVPAATATATTPVTVSGTGPVVSGSTLSEQFVSRAFQDFLGRAPSTAEQQALAALLDKGEARGIMARDIMISQEGRTHEIEQLYQKFLGRAADQGGLTNSINFLNSGGTIQALSAILMGSDEYFKLHNSTNDGFLTGIYHDVLGRAIEANALTQLGQKLTDGVSRVTMASWVLASNEGEAIRVQGFYKLLHRTPTSTEVNAYADLQLNHDARDELLEAGIAASNEYVLQQ